MMINTEIDYRMLKVCNHMSCFDSSYVLSCSCVESVTHSVSLDGVSPQGLNAKLL
jgi:hypothetical protein